MTGLTDTGVDLSKISGGQTKILGKAKSGKSDKCMGVSQLLGARARSAPQSLRLCLHTKGYNVERALYNYS